MPADVAAVVPTRDRPGSLRRCLGALANQTVAARLRILVVDDGSRDPGAVRRAADEWGADLIRLDGVGPARARNAGAREAGTPVLCFTDDDCEPETSWVEALEAAVLAGADAAAGRTLNGSSESALATASQLVADHLAGWGERGGRRAFAPSNNVACSAETFAAFPFSERYPLAAGEDREWCAALAAAGREIVHVPDAVVVHRPALSASAFISQHVRYGRGSRAFRADHPAAARHGARFYAELLRRGFSGGPRVGLALLLAQVSTLAGFVAESRDARRRRRS